MTSGTDKERNQKEFYSFVIFTVPWGEYICRPRKAQGWGIQQREKAVGKHLYYGFKE